MNSRERIIAAINHKTPDRCPCDFGATGVTGISADLMYALRKAYGLEDKPVTAFDVMQFLGKVDPDLRECLQSDAVGVLPFRAVNGIKVKDWKRWTTNLGTPVFVPGEFNTERNADGSLYAYPMGDKTAKPTCKMSKEGLYFDAISIPFETEDEDLDFHDNVEEFGLLTQEAIEFAGKQIENLYETTDKAIIYNIGGMALGDVARVPGPTLKDAKGVRSVEEWYMSHVLRPDYLKEVYGYQTELALKNLEMFYQAVGEKLQIVFLSGTDFGGQNCPLYSTDSWREIYMPYYKQMTDWIHKNTGWKVFMHTCGSVEPLIPSIIEAGIDILNPVQCSANNMEPQMLKDKYGDKIVFWGGGIDTQKTLPFGTPSEVKTEVRERIKIFNQSGGYVFATIHNALSMVPPENFMAMIEAFKEAR